MKIHYNPKLKEYARQLRNNSTKAEIKLWKLLKGKQLRGYDFHRQKPLAYFIADFYCFKLRLVIEADGATHLDEDVQRKDIFKEEQLKNLGLTVLRFSDEQVMNEADFVMRTIEKYMDEFERAGNTHPQPLLIEGSPAHMQPKSNKIKFRAGNTHPRPLLIEGSPSHMQPKSNKIKFRAGNTHPQPLLIEGSPSHKQRESTKIKFGGTAVASAAAPL